MTTDDIVIIGAGNLATQLAKNLYKHQHTIKQVYSRSIENAQLLANEINAQAINEIKKMVTNAKLYIISISDSALQDFTNRFPKVNGIVVHTAGSMDISLLSKFDNHGVFYPFQTFSKTKTVDFKEIPCLIEANNTQTEEYLIRVAKSISDDVKMITSDQRKQIHIAAVFACNFTNYFYRIAFDLLHEKNIDFDIIKPLIQETAQKIEQLNPAEAQTGPAIRKDMNIINKHMDMLNNHKELQELYQDISERIMNNKS